MKVSIGIGCLLALIHLVVSWSVIYHVATQPPDAQWQLVWVLFLPFDLPFSLVWLFSGFIFPDWNIRDLPYPISDFRGFLLPAFIHGFLGPLFYFLIPVGIGQWLTRRKYR